MKDERKLKRRKRITKITLRNEMKKSRPFHSPKIGGVTEKEAPATKKRGECLL
jgi:hypothetical protein